MTTRLVAGLVAGLTLTATASLAVPAAAEGPSTAADGRLPFQREVAQVVPDAAGGDRVLRPGTGIRGPSDGTADVYDEPCLGERTVVRGETGRAAAYRPGPGADERPVQPVVQERTFASPAAARAALADVRRVVRPCGGETARTRTETYRWYVRSMPRYGADRLSWSLRTDDIENRGVVDLHQLVLRGDTLVHVVTTRKGGLPDQAATSRLTRVALDTL